MLKRKKYDGVRAAGPVAGPTRLSTTMELWQMAVPFVISLYLCATAESEREKDVEGDRKRKRGREKEALRPCLVTDGHKSFKCRICQAIVNAVSRCLPHFPHSHWAFSIFPISLSFEIINLAAKEG